MDWYFSEANQRLGPVDDSEFRSLRESGRIGPDTLVWRSGMPDWQPLSTVDAFASAVLSSEGGFCTECGRAVGAGELLAFGNSRVCANCKDVFFQRVREQGVAVGRGKYHYAGFWIRFLARLIDGLILGAVFTPLAILVASRTGLNGLSRSDPAAPDLALAGKIIAGFAVLYVVEALLCALYEAWFVSHRGGTPGKLILGLQVVRPTGEPASFWRAFARYFGLLLSSFILEIGCIIAAFDSEKRSLHDRICDTRVIYKRG